MKQILLFLLLVGALFSSCRNNTLFEGKAELEFSTDTVFFDTVFTTVGSITERIKVFNPYDETVVIDRVYLSTGAGSNFKLNVDGVQGRHVNDVEIRGNDSIFIFVEVTVNPNGGTTPMVIEENLIVQTSDNEQSVALVAWGQDAYFYPSIEFGDLDGDGVGDLWTLPVDKPIVFYGYSVVDSGAILTIPCGARVHFHANSGLVVGKEASLKILGCEDDPIVIQGDRLESFFEEQPGQWGQLFGGIWLTAESVDNEIRNAIIKNGTVGIVVDSNVNANPTLVLENTQILNMSLFGILGQDSRIEATNTVVANCGDHAVALRFGGEYNFNHCTFANYWTGNPRSKTTLLLNNYFEVEGVEYVRDISATFTNTIIHGTLDEEIEIDFNDGASNDFYFDHCVLKRDTNELNDPDHYEGIVLNPSSPVVDGISLHPLFEDLTKDYRLGEFSRARDEGIVSDVTLDIEGSIRDAEPDIGAYEYVP